MSQERDLTPSMLLAIQQGVFYPAFFFEGEFYNADTLEPEMLRLWTGIGPLVWDGKTWHGGGDMVSISPLSESTDLKAEGWEATISGMQSTNIRRALIGMRQGKPGKLWLAGLTKEGAMIADPYLLQEGRLDVNPIIDSGDTCTISVRYESHFIDLDRARGHRYTTQELQRMSPGDLGFEYLPSLQDVSVMWGGPGAGGSVVAGPAIPSSL